MATIPDLHSQIDRRADILIAAFAAKFSQVLARAQARLLSDIQSSLILKNGVIAALPSNIRLVQALPKSFREALRAEGYDQALAQLLGGLDAGVPPIESILRTIGDAVEPGLDLEFTAGELAYFARVKTSLAVTLEFMLQQVADAARRRVAYSLAGLKPKALLPTLADALHGADAKAEVLTVTGVSTFYRVVADRGYQKIEEDFPLAYTYVGPPSSDIVIRPFCKDLMRQVEAGRTWTRAEIDQMDNHQIPGVFTSCGGFGCRHAFMVSNVG